MTVAEKAWDKAMGSQRSIISDLFFGQLKSTITCSFCKQSSTTYETFNSLTTSLPHANRCTLNVSFYFPISNSTYTLNKSIVFTGLYFKICKRAKGSRLEMSKVSNASRSYEKVWFREVGPYYSHTFKSFRWERWMARKTKHRGWFSSHGLQSETILGSGY